MNQKFFGLFFFGLIFSFLLLMSVSALSADGVDCLNDNECESDSCLDGKCGSVAGAIFEGGAEKEGLVQLIWNTLLGRDCAPGDFGEDVSWKCEEDGTYYSCGSAGVWEPPEGVPDSSFCGVFLSEVDCTLDTDCTEGVDEVICSEDASEILSGTVAPSCSAGVCMYEDFTYEVSETCDEGMVCSYEGSVAECVEDLTLGSCDEGDETCTGKSLSVCNSDLDWESRGLVDGKCGHSTSSGTGGNSNSISIVAYSPQEGVNYTSRSIALEVSDSRRRANYWKYSLNGASEVMFEPNITFTAAFGENELKVVAGESSSFSGRKSKTITFRVVATPNYDSCGDGVCGGSESIASCSSDCRAAPGYICGALGCEYDKGENSGNCPSDCASAPVYDNCGNDECEYDEGENSENCPEDCEAEKKSGGWWIAVVIFILILVVSGVAAFIILFKKGTDDTTKGMPGVTNTGSIPKTPKGVPGKPIRGAPKMPVIDVSKVPVKGAPKSSPATPVPVSNNPLKNIPKK